MIVESFLLFLVIIFLYKYFQKPEGIPPGKWGLPVIGQLPPKGTPILDFFKNLKKEFGDIFSVKMGNRLYVIMSDYSIIKSAFTKPELAGRPDFFSFRMFMYFQNLGIGGSENKVWHDNRRFALNQLRDLGMGRSILEDTIAKEVSALIEEFDKKLGESCELSWNVNVAILNIIWGLIASKRYEIDDPKIKEFNKLLTGELEIMQGPVQLFDMFPQLVPFVPRIIKTKWMKLDYIERSNEIFFNFFQEVIDEHVKNLDPDDPKDYIDAYLLEIKNQKDDKNSTFRPDYTDLKVSLGDLFTAGSETTSTSIRFTFLYLILHPEIQKKIQKNIDDVVPRDTRPNLEHQSELVYLDATLLEVQRKISLTPIGVVHSATQDTTIEGYRIPKDTVLMAFQEDCHNNPKYWEKPDEFYPEHFIDQDGKLITKKDGFLPFSVGRRVCIGESLAKMELFLFMSAILQRYTLSEVPGEKLEIKFDLDAVFINQIKPYNILLTLRK